MEQSFTEAGLRAGEVVELQWKLRPTSPAFAWWFALVHRVLGPDEVELAFPQYGESGRTRPPPCRAPMPPSHLPLCNL